MAAGKILFLASAAYPLGGVATWLDSMLEGLSGQGWNCQLGLTTGRFCDAERYLVVHPWQNTVCIRNKSGSRTGRIKSILNLLHRERPDYLIVVNTPDAYIAASKLKKDTPKVVMALHGIEPQFYKDIEDFGDVIDAVVVPSKLARHLVQSITGYPAKEVFHIPCSVPLRDIDIVPPASPLHIVYSGRLARDAKQVQDIPPVIRILEQWGIGYILTIAGDGPERKMLEHELSGKRGEIRFLGTLSKDQLYKKVYKPGRVLLITSERETGPLVAWEAMSSGMVVVCSGYRGLKAENVLTNEANSLLFPVGDHEAAATALMQSQDEQLYLSIAKAGLDLVRKKFAEELIASKWSSLLGELSTRDWSQTKPQYFDYPPDGRLAQLFGHGMAERIRILLGRRFTHQSAGGEWPHSYNSPKSSQAYSRAVRSIDR